jgi:hypothetical protein
MSASLNAEQRRAVDQFLAGQISAGALSARLEQARTAHFNGLVSAAAAQPATPVPALGTRAPAPATRARARPAARPGAAARPSPRRKLAAAGAMFALLLTGAACAWAGANALTGSVPARHRQEVEAASARRPATRHHRPLHVTKTASKKAFTPTAGLIQAPTPVRTAADTVASPPASRAAKSSGKAAAHHRSRPGRRGDAGPVTAQRDGQSARHPNGAAHRHGHGAGPGPSHGTAPGQGDNSPSGSPDQGAPPNPGGHGGPQSGGPGEGPANS